ncbi:MAG: M48 family metalloprotease [Candidatus Methanofastidiosia archaeon]
MDYILAAFFVGVLVFLFSWVLGRRKKVIDQLESDIRIFLTLVLIASFYFRFTVISLTALLAALREFDFIYLATFSYFLFPLLLGLFLLVFSATICKRELHARDVSIPAPVEKVSDLLDVKTLPDVVVTPFETSPLVYRGFRNSALVLPENFDSLFTEEEQEAVIAHELAHIKQGDVRFFMWLTFLWEGFKYWIVLLPIFVYLGVTSLFFGTQNSIMSSGIIVVFSLFLYLSKNSLSRTRESISDAYAVFHGYGKPLKSALYKISAVGIMQKGWVFKLCFHRSSTRSLSSTHPPLKARIKTIDNKTFLAEPVKNLPPELAFWVGLVIAFLSYNVMYGWATVLAVKDAVSSVPSGETALAITWIAPSLLTMGVVSISYVFPATKGLVQFSDFHDSRFVVPFVRNWMITVAAAAMTMYGLTLQRFPALLLVQTVFIGFFVWLTGFAASKSPDITNKSWSVALLPFFPVGVLWVPMHIVYTYFRDSAIDTYHLVPSVAMIILFSVLALALLMEYGLIGVERERIVLFFGKRIEILHSLLALVACANILIYLVPTGFSLLLFSVSCFIDSLGIVPEMTFFFLVVIFLVPIVFKKSDILFFHNIVYLVNIAQGRIPTEDVAFIQKVIIKYQSPDGGFDCAGLNFSNQKSTHDMVKTALTLGQHVENERIVEWIMKTESKGGFAYYPGGTPRIESTYYALETLSFLGVPDAACSSHIGWVKSFFRGKYFLCDNDTISPVLQTCYVVELMPSCGGVDESSEMLKSWIETHFATLKPVEALHAARALRILHSDMKVVERWLKKNESVLQTRLDKNTEAEFYYLSVLREQGHEIPSLVMEEALTELTRLRKKYDRTVDR